ncbi:conserved protein, unknown function, partial [Hepatocystis sp. ex Piliocolobus tephrosceles]
VKLPFICVLCKRTGRKLKVWNIKNFEDPICAQSQLYEFIEMMESKNNTNYDTSNNNNNNNNNTSYALKEENALLNKTRDNIPYYNAVRENVYKNKILLNNTLTHDNKQNKTIENKINTVHKSQTVNDKNIKSETNLVHNTNVEIKNTESLIKYNQINNELNELHKLRMQRFQKK